MTVAGAGISVASLLAVIGLLAASGGGGGQPVANPSAGVEVQTLPPVPTAFATPTAPAGPTTAPPEPTQEAPPPAPAPPPPPAPPSVPAANPEEAVAFAYAEGMKSGRFNQVGVALFDTVDGVLYGQGLDNVFVSASVYKVFVAAKLLHTGATQSPEWDSQDANDLRNMIINSDNNATIRLNTNWTGGTAATIEWVTTTYGVSGITHDPSRGFGGTKITARAMVQFYRAVKNDPAVYGELYGLMSGATVTGGKNWGLPKAAAAGTWAVKHGWICCGYGPGSIIHSTGYVEGGRYIAILLTRGPSSLYDSGNGFAYITTMAKAMLPGGHIPVPGVPTPTPTEEPSPTPTPTPSEEPEPDPSSPGPE